MAWGEINGLLLVSGGLGVDKETVIEAGGYYHKSLGEDMELITRMRKLMHQKKGKVLDIIHSEPLCWTEVPSSMRIFLRQRIRWARGLIQHYIYIEKYFYPKYGKTGLLIFPYYLLYEFAVPILEVLGLLALIVSIFF
jgi:cellulose synthase/poly-beta-1,6-N-acetylglucosamine synthase-like glycosyltransferase